jgi:hypothetical protein
LGGSGARSDARSERRAGVDVCARRRKTASQSNGGLKPCNSERPERPK